MQWRDLLKLFFDKKRESVLLSFDGLVCLTETIRLFALKYVIVDSRFPSSTIMR